MNKRVSCFGFRVSGLGYSSRQACQYAAPCPRHAHTSLFQNPITPTRPHAPYRITAPLVVYLVFLLLVPALHAQPVFIQTDWHTDFEARRDALIDYYATRIPADDLTTGGYFDIAARLYQNKDMDWVLARLDTLMEAPRGDMFWMYPMVAVNFIGKDKLPEAYRKRLRDLWRTYRPYRGDTENHWAMYYTAMYLMAELYPDDPAESWYNGRSSAENRAEAKEYLIDWMNITTTIGQGEFDSARYMDFYLIPMAQLHAFAQDPEMRRRGQMMLDYLLADFAVDNLNGMYAGASSRLYPTQVLERWKDNIVGYAWLLFGNTTQSMRGGGILLAMSGYQPPEVLYRIATDRSQPYVQKELKRTRHRIRNSDVRNVPVYKYMYMSEAYAIGSIQGGLLQPIQQHTWEVLWANENPEEGFNVLFNLHPYSSAHELAMYFPEEPKLLTEAVVRSKNTYDSGDKWVSGSPYEQVLQEKDALIVLYDIPKGTRFSHISGFFSRHLTQLEEDESGWIFVRGGDAYIAYYPLSSYTWIEDEGGDKRLHSEGLKNGAVVQVATASEFPSFDAFKAKISALHLEVAASPQLQVSFTSLRGDRMTAVYGEPPVINGAPVNYSDWKQFDGPYLYAEQGSKKLELRHGTLRRLLDFEEVSIKDWIIH